ncbi:MAG: 16S rRNA (uracil(1498)-N(3))-methyltransferase [Nitrospira sp.]
MPVFLLPPDAIASPLIIVPAHLVSHLRDSLRIEVGETLWFGDGQGTRYRAAITDISKRSVSARILETIREPARHTPRVILGQSLLKGEKMDWVVQKATELGVDELVPIESRHSVVQLKADRVDHQLARWQRIAFEAAQQSEQWRVPTIALPQSLHQFLAGHTTCRTNLILAERRDGRSLQTVALPSSADDGVTIVIGPEGGWSQDELMHADQAGMNSITLGPMILRAETAAITALAIVQSRLGKLG